MQGFAQLVGAGRGAHSTTDALQAADDFSHGHSLHQTGNALQVAIATIPILHVLDDTAFHLDEDVRAARALGLVMVFHAAYSSPSSGFMLV